MHRIVRDRVRKLVVACSFLAASGARAADVGANVATRAAELSRSGRFEEAALAWRQVAQGSAAVRNRPEQV